MTLKQPEPEWIGVKRKHFLNKIFLILWARHPETLAEKEQIRNELEFFSKLYPKTIKIDPDYWKIYSSLSINTREVSYTSLETALNKLSWKACFLSKKKETTSLNAFKLTLISIKYHQNLNCELSVTQIIWNTEAKINQKGSLLYEQHFHKNWLEKKQIWDVWHIFSKHWSK